MKTKTFKSCSGRWWLKNHLQWKLGNDVSRQRNEKKRDETFFLSFFFSFLWFKCLLIATFSILLLNSFNPLNTWHWGLALRFKAGSVRIQNRCSIQGWGCLSYCTASYGNWHPWHHLRRLSLNNLFILSTNL